MSSAHLAESRFRIVLPATRGESHITAGSFPLDEAEAIADRLRVLWSDVYLEEVSRVCEKTEEVIR
jgi:hypothetical protein